MPFEEQERELLSESIQRLRRVLRGAHEVAEELREEEEEAEGEE